MTSQEVLRELEKLFKLERAILPNEIFHIVDKLENNILKKNILAKLVSRGMASSSREAKSWRHLTPKTSISLAIEEIRHSEL